MNKRIFTLLTAGLLLGGPAFNAAYAADVDFTEKTAISYDKNETALANGLSFYLGGSSSALLKATSVLETKDGKEVVSFESTTASEVGDATVFTIRNYSSSSFELWAKVGKKEYLVAVNDEGQDLASASDKKLSELKTKFTTATAKLKFKGLYTVTVPTKQVKTDLQAFSYEGKANAAYLNDYNSNGTTLSFDYKRSSIN